MSGFEIPSERESLYLENARAAFDEQVNPWLDPIIGDMAAIILDEAVDITERTSREGWLYDQLMGDLLSQDMLQILDDPDVIREMKQVMGEVVANTKASLQPEEPQEENESLHRGTNDLGALLRPRSSALQALAEAMEATAAQPPAAPADAHAMLLSAMEQNIRTKPTLNAMLGASVVLDDLKRQSSVR